MVFTRHALEVQSRNPTNQNKKWSMFWTSMVEKGLQASFIRLALVNLKINKGKLTLQNCKTTLTAVVFRLHNKVSCHFVIAVHILHNTTLMRCTNYKTFGQEAVLTNSEKTDTFSHINSCKWLEYFSVCWISSILSLHRTDAHSTRSCSDNIK